jgi:hypothetical protein
MGAWRVDKRSDMPRESVRPGPVFGVAHGPRFDRVSDEVGDGLEDRFRRQQRMGATTLLVEHFFGPLAIGLRAQSEVAVEGPRELRRNHCSPEMGSAAIKARWRRYLPWSRRRSLVAVCR